MKTSLSSIAVVAILCLSVCEQLDAQQFQTQTQYQSQSAQDSSLVFTGMKNGVPSYMSKNFAYDGPGTMRDHLWQGHANDLKARGISQSALMAMPMSQVQQLHNQFHAAEMGETAGAGQAIQTCLLYTSPSPRDS